MKVLSDSPAEAMPLGRQGPVLYNPHAERREMVEQPPSPRAEVVFTVVGGSVFSEAVMISTHRQSLCGLCQCFGLGRTGAAFKPPAQAHLDMLVDQPEAS